MLNTWLGTLETQFAHHVLIVDFETARLWGEISARAQESGVMLSTTDGLIAATALRHGLRLMTGRATRFVTTGVLIVDPWKDSEKESRAE